MIVPILMTFNIGLIHTIESEVIHHGIHTGLTGIVARTDSIDISPLHQHQILHHTLSGDGTTINRIGILRVHAFEKYALAIDIHAVSSQLHVTEILITLYYFYGIEYRCLCSP